MTYTACALGFFDGVHRAHAHILTSCAAYARAQGLKSVAVTFDRSPAEFFGHKVEYLTDSEYKKELILACGIDDIYFLKADFATLSLKPEEFFQKYIVGTLHAGAVFCGFNYSFGKDAAGDTMLLTALCRSSKIEPFVLNCMEYNGTAVSSSAVRSALHSGDTALAAGLLSRPFEARGTVEYGKQLGRSIGLPTVNLYPSASFPALPRGVYITLTRVDGVLYPSVTNVGVNPTVNDGNLRIETHIIGFDRDIYGKKIAVLFYKHLRGEIKFDSVESLRQQIEKDKASAVSYLNQKTQSL